MNKKNIIDEILEIVEYEFNNRIDAETHALLEDPKHILERIRSKILFNCLANLEEEYEIKLARALANLNR